MKDLAKYIKEQVLSSPGASYWLKEAIKTADRRDPVDMARDARIILKYCEAILNDLDYFDNGSGA